MSAAQVARPRRLETGSLRPIDQAAPAEVGRVGTRAFLVLAAIPFLPILGSWAWLALVEPDLGVRLALVPALACAATVGLFALAVKEVRRSVIAQARELGRTLRKCELGDPVVVPSFADGDFERLAQMSLAICRRMNDSEARSLETSVRVTSLSNRHEQVVEHLTNENVRLRSTSDTVHQFSTILSREMGDAQICNELIFNIADHVQFKRAIVFLLDESSRKLGAVAVRDAAKKFALNGDFVRDTPIGLACARSSVANWAVETRRPVRVNDTAVDARWTDLLEDVKSVLVIPLHSRRGVIGAIQLELDHRGGFDAASERIVTSLANTAGIAVENAKLLREAARVRALEELDRLKTELISNVSHELRTPITSIKGYSQSLLRQDVEWPAGTVREFLEIIDEESDRLRAIIEDVLQISQIQSGVMKVDLRRLRVRRVIRSLVVQNQRHAMDHQFVVEVPNGFPAILADKLRFEQVLRNLIENAVKYSPSGGTITVRAEVAEPDMARFSVQDEGIGIPEDEIGQVFERFFRSSDGQARRAGGFGLGLSICRGIVEMHNGRIAVQSREGEGSTFSFTIPLAPPEDASDSEIGLAESEEEHE